VRQNLAELLDLLAQLVHLVQQCGLLALQLVARGGGGGVILHERRSTAAETRITVASR
jgi:hypothetical protein